jgi:cell wall-associated NlpC family hydrolase
MATYKQYRAKPLIILAVLLIMGFTVIRFFSIEKPSNNTFVPVHTPVTPIAHAIDTTIQVNRDSAIAPVTETEQLSATGNAVNTGSITPGELTRFAETLTGVPYVWASSDPQVGFDCSGFITYVFNHFNIAVPRSSIDFTNIGRSVSVGKAKRGDLILFTGTDPLEKDIGHMGIVVTNTIADGLMFIHATSGRTMSVTISKLNEQYTKRFVRVSRIFQQNG